MFNCCGNLIISELLLTWTLVSPSERQITYEKGIARTLNKDFGDLERNDCDEALQFTSNYVFEIYIYLVQYPKYENSELCT